jgi:hypothetical protein
MKQWEYLVIARCDFQYELQYELNKLGGSNWELVAIRSYGNDNGNEDEFFFKRELPQ